MHEQTPQGVKGRRAEGSQGGRVAGQRERSAGGGDRSTTSRSVSGRWNGRTGPSQARTEIERQGRLRREEPGGGRGFGFGGAGGGGGGGGGFGGGGGGGGG